MNDSEEMNNSEEVLVYFHGSFGFRTIEGYVEAYVPKIDVHVNLIGTWAGLHAMKPGFEYTARRDRRREAAARN